MVRAGTDLGQFRAYFLDVLDWSELLVVVADPGMDLDTGH
jgi:hypothetical protein